MNDSRLSKLPIWAQLHIRVLEDQLAGRTHELAVYQGEQSSSITWRYAGKEQPVPDGTIRFSLPDARYIALRIDRGMLYVNTDEILLFQPQASNAAYLRSVPFGK